VTSGDIVLTGYFAATQATIPTLNFGGSCSPITSNTGVGGDGYLAKLSGFAGSCLWARGFNGAVAAPYNAGVGVATDVNRNVVLTES